MAKKKETAKTVLERVYNVPLRKEYMKVGRWKRTKKAVVALQEFIAKHMKSENVKIGRYANEYLWKHGMKNPPHHIKVTALKDDKGIVTAELTELPSYAKREQEKQKAKEKAKDEKKKKEDKKDEKKEAKSSIEKKEQALEHKIEDAKIEHQKEAKEIQKEEIKETIKEGPKGKPEKLAPEPREQEQHQQGPRHV